MSIIPDKKEVLRRFVVEKLAKVKNVEAVDDTTNLIESGVIDSLGIVNLVSYLENAFGVKIKDEDIIPDHFESIRAIAEYLERL